MLGYRRFGGLDATGLPIVVIPGFGVSRYLDGACEELARQRRASVLLVDPPGFGVNKRSISGSVTASAVADVLARWLADLGPSLLVGQSTGCLISARVASGVDVSVDMVRALALVGPVFDPQRASIRSAGLALVRDGLREPWWLGPREAPEWASNAVRLPSFLKSCLAERLAEQLAMVRCPVAVIRGDRDRMSRHAWAAGLAEGPDRTLVTVPGGAHTFMAGAPAALTEALEIAGFGLQDQEPA